MIVCILVREKIGFSGEGVEKLIFEFFVVELLIEITVGAAIAAEGIVEIESE